MQPFTYDPPAVRVVFGAGSARTRLAEEVERLGLRRVLLIASGRDEALAADVTAQLGSAFAARFSQVREHVPVEVAEAARAAAAQAGADGVLAVGGGSTVGTAKAIALTTGLPVVAVPTTFAGSEVTRVWGITTDGVKTTGVDPAVVPRTVVYDPELVSGLPPALAAASGLNAMAHAVEAFWAPGRNPVTSVTGAEAVRVLAAALPALVEGPDGGDAADSGVRTAVYGDAVYGAYLAGTTFAVAGSGLHHKICHVLGGAFTLPHAQTHAIVLPYVVAFLAPAVPDVAVRLATALTGDPGADPAAALQGLARRLGVPHGLADLGLPADGVERVVAPIVAAAPADTPRPVTPDAVRALLTAALTGAPLAG